MTKTGLLHAIGILSLGSASSFSRDKTLKITFFVVIGYIFADEAESLMKVVGKSSCNLVS